MSRAIYRVRTPPSWAGDAPSEAAHPNLRSLSLLEATGIDDDTPLEVSTDGDVIIVSPVRSKRRTAKLKGILVKLHKQHAGAFRRLAE